MSTRKYKTLYFFDFEGNDRYKPIMRCVEMRGWIETDKQYRSPSRRAAPEGLWREIIRKSEINTILDDDFWDDDKTRFRVVSDSNDPALVNKVIAERIHRSIKRHNDRINEQNACLSHLENDEWQMSSMEV